MTITTAYIHHPETFNHDIQTPKDALPIIVIGETSSFSMFLTKPEALKLMEELERALIHYELAMPSQNDGIATPEGVGSDLEW